MPKESPFFKFDAQGWLSGSIQFTSLECKGLFTDLCALYWDSQKPVKIDAKLLARSKVDEGTLSDLIGTLSNLEVISVSSSEITIPFIDELIQERNKWIEKCAEGGRSSKVPKGTLKVPPSNKKEERREKKEESKEEEGDARKALASEFPLSFKLLCDTVGGPSIAQGYLGTYKKRGISDAMALVAIERFKTMSSEDRRYYPFSNADKSADSIIKLFTEINEASDDSFGPGYNPYPRACDVE